MFRSTARRALRRLAAPLTAVLIAFFAFAGSAWAAVEVNNADQSQLESIKGIGPALSGKILTERKQGAFKDWSDFATRVSGVGEKNSAGFSRAGLTVAGKAKDGAQASPDAARGTKTALKKGAADAGTATVARK